MSDSFLTPWTVARQAPLSMEFSRQENRNELPFPSPGDLPNPGLNLGLLHYRCILYCLSHQGSPVYVYIYHRYFYILFQILSPYQFSSVARSCPTLRDSMDCSIPGLPVHHQLPELTQTHVHWVGDAIQPSHTLSSPSPPAFNLSPASGSFPMSQFFTSSGQIFGVSASTSVLLRNIQDWFPSRLTGFISLQYRGLSRVFSNTTVQKHWFFIAQLSLWSNTHIHTWLQEKPYTLITHIHYYKI